MKKRIFCGLFALLPLGAFASGVPVIDAANLEQSLLNYAQLLLQVETLAKQLSEQQAIYANFTGTRGMGLLEWQTTVRSLIPSDAADVLKAVMTSGNGKSALSGDALSLWEELGVEERCSRLSDAQKTLCLREGALQAVAITNCRTAEDRIEKRSKSIESLMEAINRTTDAKESADLSARLQAETAALEAEGVRLRAVAAAGKEEQAVLAREAQAEAEKHVLLTDGSHSELEAAMKSIW